MNVTRWDQKCEEILKQRKNKLNKQIYTRDRRDFEEYKRIRVVPKKIKKKKKKTIDFCNSINRFTSPSYVWNTMRVF